ncbi:threonine dehydratase [compost metagenome]
MRWLYERAQIVAEPSGAATVAAAIRPTSEYAAPVVAIISGGNLGPEDLAKYTTREA